MRQGILRGFTAGSDSNAGTSIDSAWKTIGKVNATVFDPGSCLLFKRGELFRYLRKRNKRLGTHRDEFDLDQRVYLGQRQQDLFEPHYRAKRGLLPNVDEPGIVITNYGAGFAVENNMVSGNLVVRTGLSSKENQIDVGLQVKSMDEVSKNTIRNNVFFNGNRPAWIDYRGRSLTVHQFQEFHGTGGDAMEGNAVFDPGFLNPEAHDFTLRADSPCP